MKQLGDSFVYRNSDQPGVAAQAIPYYFSITSTSAYKDQAAEVLKYLASDDYQLEWAKKLGTVPVLKNQTIKAALGEDSPFKGKNFSALYEEKLAPLAAPSKYDSAVEDIYAKAAVQVAEGTLDLNTALRNAEDEAKKAVAAAKQSQ